MKKVSEKSKILTPPVSSEGIAGARGLSLPVEPTSIYDDGEDFFIPDENEEYPPSTNNIKYVIDLLVELGDGLDRKGDDESRRLASFADFLLVKIAEQKNKDYTKLFNSLIEKIADSDILDSNDLIIKLSKIYSRSIVFNVSSGKSIDESKRMAYMKVVKRADMYIGGDR